MTERATAGTGGARLAREWPDGRVRLAGRYRYLMTTQRPAGDRGRDRRATTYSYRYSVTDGRGADLGLLLFAAVFCARAGAGAGRPAGRCRSVPVSGRAGENTQSTWVLPAGPVTRKLC